jgi:hypothetical protein
MAFDATKECEDYPESWNGEILLQELHDHQKNENKPSSKIDWDKVPEDAKSYIRSLEIDVTSLNATMMGIERYKKSLHGETTPKEILEELVKYLESARDKFFADHPEV